MDEVVLHMSAAQPQQSEGQSRVKRKGNGNHMYLFMYTLIGLSIFGVSLVKHNYLTV